MTADVVLGSSDAGFQQIRDGIDGSEYFLVFGTASYFNDARCYLHFEYACEKRKKIVVVIGRGESLPNDFLQLVSVHGVDLLTYDLNDGEAHPEAMRRALNDIFDVDVGAVLTSI